MTSLGQKPSRKELDAIIKNLDADGDGVIDFAEFIITMMTMSYRVRTTICNISLCLVLQFASLLP